LVFGSVIPSLHLYTLSDSSSNTVLLELDFSN
jgi:hypothetical protein